MEEICLIISDISLPLLQNELGHESDLDLTGEAVLLTLGLCVLLTMGLCVLLTMVCY